MARFQLTLELRSFLARPATLSLALSINRQRKYIQVVELAPADPFCSNQNQTCQVKTQEI
jgi:hypothetical protein